MRDRLTDKSTEELLELMLIHMQNMDRRDKLRTIGGFFKGLLAIIPIAILLLSTWYFYTHKDTLMQDMTKQIMTQMTSIMPQPSVNTMDSEMVQRIQDMMKKN